MLEARKLIQFREFKSREIFDRIMYHMDGRTDGRTYEYVGYNRLAGMTGASKVRDYYAHIF